MAKITKIVERFTGDNNRKYSYASLILKDSIDNNFYTKDEIDNKINKINLNNISEGQLIELKLKLDNVHLNNFLSDNDGNILEDSDGQPIHE